MGGFKVVKHNNLIDCKSECEFSKFEHQVIATAISKISMLDNEFTDIELSVDELYELSYGAQLSGTTKKDVISKLRELKGKTITIKDINDSNIERDYNWFSVFEYSYKYKTGTIKFSNELKDYLLNLNDNFNNPELKIYYELDSGYGIRLFELMDRIFGNVNTRKIKVSELREMLQIGDKYSRMYDFRKHVIDIAVKEVNQIADFKLTYEEIKIGRNIEYIKFIKGE